MAKKEFTYRGKTLEELKSLSRDQMAELLPARERRSIKRGYQDEWKKVEQKIINNDRVKTHIRELIILPTMVGKIVLVHNGKQFIEVRVNEDMIGHRLGEYAPTRNRVQHNAPGVGATRSSAALSVR